MDDETPHNQGLVTVLGWYSKGHNSNSMIMNENKKNAQVLILVNQWYSSRLELKKRNDTI